MNVRRLKLCNLSSINAHKQHTYSTAIVQFNGSFALLGGIIKLVPTKVKTAVAVITRELGTAHVILHHTKLQKGNEQHCAVDLCLGKQF